MKAKFFLSCIALAILFNACNTTNRTPKQEIEQQIDSLLKEKKATVGVAVLANGETVAVYNNQIHFPQKGRDYRNRRCTGEIRRF